VPEFTVAILTISDRSAAGLREDLSGPALVRILQLEGYKIVVTKIVPDEIDDIESILTDWADNNIANLILTTGGTGFAPRDVTPEATKKVIERETPGLVEAMRSKSLLMTPHAMLSRSVAGIRKKSLIINLPGSPKAAVENLQVVFPVLSHGLSLLLELPETEMGHTAK
jgi:molybdenum cofactor synthesis domain-containing protein